MLTSLDCTLHLHLKLTNFGVALTQSFEKLDNWLTAKKFIASPLDSHQ
jgi:hypothetical protein